MTLGKDLDEKQLLPPHINFFHPFISDHTAKTKMSGIEEIISRELTFDLELKNFGYFAHADGVTIHLGVHMRGKAGEMVRAEKFLAHVARQLKLSEKKPFVFVAKVDDKKTAALLVEELEKKWSPIKFTVNGLSWLKKNGEADEQKEHAETFVLEKFFPLKSATKHKEEEEEKMKMMYRDVMARFQPTMLSCASRCAEYKSTDHSPCPFDPEEMFSQSSTEDHPMKICIRLMDKIIEIFHTWSPEQMYFAVEIFSAMKNSGPRKSMSMTWTALLNSIRTDEKRWFSMLNALGGCKKMLLDELALLYHQNKNFDDFGCLLSAVRRYEGGEFIFRNFFESSQPSFSDSFPSSSSSSSSSSFTLNVAGSRERCPDGDNKAPSYGELVGRTHTPT